MTNTVGAHETQETDGGGEIAIDTHTKREREREREPHARQSEQLRGTFGERQKQIQHSNTGGRENVKEREREKAKHVPEKREG